LDILEIPRQDFERALSENPLLIMIVGSTEQHGRHLPLGTDVLIPLGIAESVSQKMKNALICPPLAFGVYSGDMSGGGRAFLGTTCISSGTLESLVHEILNEYELQGLKRYLILNGHSENDSALVSAMYKVVTKNEGAKALVVNWWNMLSPTFIDKHVPEPARVILGGHASYLETLALLAVRPDLVHLEELASSAPVKEVKYEVFPVDPDTLPPSGVFWPNDPRLKASLTKELAKLAFSEIVANIIVAIEKDLPASKKR
jgi:creatinine amidohydrolase